MPVSLIPKEAYQERGRGPAISILAVRQNIVPLLAGVLLLAAGGIYGLLFFYEASLSRHQTSLASAYQEINSRIDTEDRILAANFALRAEELRRIVNAHHTPSTLLALMEETTHPDVTFTSFTFSFEGGEVRIDGATSGFDRLAEQVLVWERDPSIKGVEISNFAVDTTGELKFTAVLSLAENYAQS